MRSGLAASVMGIYDGAAMPKRNMAGNPTVFKEARRRLF